MPPELTDEMDFKKDVLPFLAKYGIGTVLALYLVWFVTGRVENRLQNIEAYVSANQSETSNLRNSVDGLKNSTDSLKNEQQSTNLILQQICVNGASLRDRGNCFR